MMWRIGLLVLIASSWAPIALAESPRSGPSREATRQETEETAPPDANTSQTDWSMVFRAAADSRPGATEALDQIQRGEFRALASHLVDTSKRRNWSIRP